MTTKMIDRSAYRCKYGCCGDDRTKKVRRSRKRRERQGWKNEVRRWLTKDTE